MELSEFFLVHLIGNKLELDAVSVETELTDIQQVLRKKSLDIVAVPIPTSKSLLEKFGEPAAVTHTDSEKNVLQKYLHDHLKEQFTEICLHCSEATNFGVDITTEWLTNASVEDVQELLAVLGEFNDNCDKCETTTDSTANKMKKIKCLSLATNSYTHKHISAIHAWAATRGNQSNLPYVLYHHLSVPLSITHMLHFIKFFGNEFHINILQYFFLSHNCSKLFCCAALRSLYVLRYVC